MMMAYWIFKMEVTCYCDTAAAIKFLGSRMEADDDTDDLGPKEVAIRMMFAPINPSDINQVPRIAVVLYASDMFA